MHIINKVIIYADTREFGSRITSILKKRCEVREKQLVVADYLLSERCACERKTSQDFLQSIIDRRLFEQLKALKEFEVPIMIIEGGSLFDVSINIHPNAIRGALAAIAITGVPVLWTASPLETAEQLLAIAKREQIDENRNVSIRGKRRFRSMNEQQEFLIAGFSKISTKKAKTLLNRFGSPERIFAANEKELQEVDGIGKDLAKRMRELLTRKYEKSILD